MDYRFLLIFLFGFLGGLGAFVLGAPMPFLLGGIFGAAGFVLYYERDGKQLPKLSRWVRLIFMSIIGSMIGSRFSPELLTLLPQFWLSGLAIIPFILIVQYAPITPNALSQWPFKLSILLCFLLSFLSLLFLMIFVRLFTLPMLLNR